MLSPFYCSPVVCEWLWKKTQIEKKKKKKIAKKWMKEHSHVSVSRMNFEKQMFAHKPECK